MAGGGATIEELKDVLRETLENRGALGGVRAHLRAEVRPLRSFLMQLTHSARYPPGAW
jgi:hypothetical protein